MLAKQGLELGLRAKVLQCAVLATFNALEPEESPSASRNGLDAEPRRTYGLAHPALNPFLRVPAPVREGTARTPRPRQRFQASGWLRPESLSFKTSPQDFLH